MIALAYNSRPPRHTHKTGNNQESQKYQDALQKNPCRCLPERGRLLEGQARSKRDDQDHGRERADRASNVSK